jgi:uncharacterized protein
MELLYPLRSSPRAGGLPATDSVTVLVTRVVPVAEEASFRAGLDGLLEDFDRFPGTSGSLVFRREAGGGVEFSILQRFARGSDHDAWLLSPGFARWRREVAPATPTPGHVRRYSGMDALFASAGASDGPPRWKMALLLLVAVYPMSLGVSLFLAPALSRLPVLAGAALTSVLMVLGMTYVIVPVLTRLFQAWLQPTPGSA